MMIIAGGGCFAVAGARSRRTLPRLEQNNFKKKAKGRVSSRSNGGGAFWFTYLRLYHEVRRPLLTLHGFKRDLIPRSQTSHRRVSVRRPCRTCTTVGQTMIVFVMSNRSEYNDVNQRRTKNSASRRHSHGCFRCEEKKKV